MPLDSLICVAALTLVVAVYWRLKRLSQQPFEINSTCIAIGVHGLLIVPPRLGAASVAGYALIRLGQWAGLETALLQRPRRRFESDVDSDHFHMNSICADNFTACLALLLRRAVERAEGR